MLGFIIDEKVSIVNRFGQRSMLLPKLRKVEPRGGKDKLGIPDLLVLVGVTGIKVRTLTCASLSVGEKPNGNGNNRSAFPGGIVYLVPTKSKESSKERNTLRLTSPVDSPNDELSLVCEKGEQYTNCKDKRWRSLLSLRAWAASHSTNCAGVSL